MSGHLAAARAGLFRPRSPLRDWAVALFCAFFIALAICTLCAAPAPSTPAAPVRSYHFDPRGNDETGDGTADHPWASLSKAGSLSLRPGDKILLAAGQAFRGHLLLDHDATGSAGTPDAPITIGSYGQGRATIEAGDDDGILVRNAGGVRVENLVVRGANAATETGTKAGPDGQSRAGRTNPRTNPTNNHGSGVKFLNTLPGSRRLAFVRVDHVEASGFGREGIVVIGWAGDASQSGFRGVRITDCVAHDNTYYGIYVSGRFDAKAAGYADADVYVGRCTAYANRGDPGFRGNHSGSGIFVEDTDGAVVEGCTAHDNGELCPGTHGGPCGIWAANARDVTIQRCQSYANRCAAAVDGDGFDFDGGCTHCLMQYNYSHDNQGAGFLVYNYKGAPHASGRVVLRYNVSAGDARRGDYAALHVVNDGDGINDVEVYNNTICVRPREARDAAQDRNGGEVPQALRVQRTTGARFLNNLFCAGGTGGGGSGARAPRKDLLLLIGGGQSGLVFRGNCYWNADGPVRIADGDKTYDSLETWRDATGRERDGTAETGLAVDPRLAGPVRAPEREAGERRLRAADRYRLRPDSPLRGAGVEAKGPDLFPTAERDFFGRPLNGDARRTIGAGG